MCINVVCSVVLELYLIACSPNVVHWKVTTLNYTLKLDSIAEVLKLLSGIQLAATRKSEMTSRQLSIDDIYNKLQRNYSFLLDEGKFLLSEDTNQQLSRLGILGQTVHLNLFLAHA